jgi:hypothetical protein
MVITTPEQAPLTIEQEPAPGHKVLVIGEPRRVSETKVAECLDTLISGGYGISLVIHDHSSRIAQYVAEWAKENNVSQLVIPLYWGNNIETKNVRMLAYDPDFILLFSDGQDNDNMLEHAQRGKIKVWSPL